MTELSASISVNDVTVRYNNGHTAIYDVTFALQGGTICALVGVNGSGKSTLFKSIMGLMMLAAAKGTIIELETDGLDEAAAMKALTDLINDYFGEGE